MSSREAETKAHSERVITGVPEGLDALVLAQLAAEAGHGSAPGTLLHVARDDRRLDALERSLAFFAPQVRVVSIPAWDTVPYDRVGPQRRHRGQAHRGARQVELEHAQAPHRGADDGQCRACSACRLAHS